MSDSASTSQDSGRRRGFFETLTDRLASLQRSWRSSISLRTLALISIFGIVGLAVTGIFVVTQIRSSVFEQSLNTKIEQFSTDSAVAQDRFSASSSPTVGQSQQIANEIVAGMYDPSRGLLGGVLVRSKGQESGAVQIVEPETASATQVRSLVTPELSAAVSSSSEIAWMSVEVPGTEGGTSPGVILGTLITIPSSGDYELYAAYSMEPEEDMLRTTFRVLTFSVIALVLILGLVSWILMRVVLRPIREASEGAQQLAEGEFDTRMEVRGTDELAQLSKSFNQMASSLEEQFTRMERMSKVQTDFVSAVSHELRSPVTTIRMAGQLIYDKRDELSPSLRRSAELQHSQLINLDTMLSDLLEISRYDAGGMSIAAETADVAEIAQRVIEMSEPLATDNGVSVEFSATGNTEALVEARRIERVLRNLVVNALEHAESRPVRVRVVGGTDAVAVEVTDHGVGISAEQSEHVFERFWRADSSRVRKSGGTGLGLTIAREDALLHGGTLEATGELGVGSTFLLTIPRSPGADYTRPVALRVPEPYEEPDNAASEADQPEARADSKADTGSQVPPVVRSSASTKPVDTEVSSETPSDSSQAEEDE